MRPPGTLVGPVVPRVGEAARERPILFSAPMVRALLTGSKTQTRRIVKGAPVEMVRLIGRDDRPTGEFGFCATHERVIDRHVACPYGVPGDVLWVRETICIGEDLGEDWEDWMEQGDRFVLYPAGGGRDQDYCVPADYEVPGNAKVEHHGVGSAEHWRQFGPIVSIHMPRWASRISLRITDVRVERLNEITCVDAMAEGITSRLIECADGVERNLWFGVPQAGNESPVQAYADLWDSINNPKGYCAEDEPRGWAANPWVWAVSFEVAREPQANTGHTNGNSGNTPDQDQRP